MGVLGQGAQAEGRSEPEYPIIEAHWGWTGWERRIQQHCKAIHQKLTKKSV